MLAFWIDSHNLTRLTGLANAFTGVLFTDQTISSITGKLLDASDEQVGDDIPFTYDEPGKWHAVWQRTMVEGQLYRLRVEVTGSGLTLTIIQQLPARYRGPQQ